MTTEIQGDTHIKEKPLKPISDDEMIDLEEMRKKKFFDKHPPLENQEAINNRIQEREEAKSKYTRDIATVEQNLMSFLNRESPILVDGVVVAWVKEIPYFRLLDMIPESVLADMESDEEISFVEATKRIKEGHANFQFQLYEELVTIPSKSAEWWKENVTQAFMDAFDKHIEKTMQGVQDSISFFSPQTKQ